MTCDVYAPPSDPRHSLDLTKPRVFFSGSTYLFNKLHADLDDIEDDVDLFVSRNDIRWDLDYASHATLVVIDFELPNTHRSFNLLGRFRSSGKVVAHATQYSQQWNDIQTICNYDGTTLTSTPERLVDAVLVTLGHPRKYSTLIPTKN